MRLRAFILAGAAIVIVARYIAIRYFYAPQNHVEPFETTATSHISFDATQHPISSVTVFQSRRAEIRRQVRVQLKVHVSNDSRRFQIFDASKLLFCFAS
jgi:hypothetical protein